MELRQISDSLWSLEFEPVEKAVVRAAIRELFGDARELRDGQASEVRFGGESFVYQEQWDDPCLIADSPAGHRLLAQLSQHLMQRRG